MATPADSERLQNVREQLTCSICQDLFKEPVSLPCFHSFCRKCLEGYVQNRPLNYENGLDERDSRDKVDCPICKERHQLPEGGVKNIRTNHLLKNMVSSVELPGAKCGDCIEETIAVAFCNDCNKPLCTNCKNHHERAKATHSHDVKEIRQGDSEMVEQGQRPKASGSGQIPERTYSSHCDSHPGRPVEYYCSECDKVACATCAAEEHKPHSCIRAEIIVDDYKTSIGDLIKQTQNVADMFRNAIGEVETVLKGLEESKRTKTEEVCKQYEEVRREIDKQKEKLLQSIEQISQKKKKHLSDQLKELSKIKNTFQESLKFVRNAQGYSPVDFFFLWSQIDQRLKYLLKEYGNHSREPRDTDVIQFASNENLIMEIMQSNAIGEVFSDPHASEFTVDNFDTVHLIQGKPSKLTVTCRDIIGNKLCDHCPALVAKFQQGEEEAVDGDITKKDNGTYEISFQPQVHGVHTMKISMRMNGRDVFIKGSPFRINVAPPHCEAVVVQTISKTITNDTMRKPWGIVVMARDNRIVTSDVGTNRLVLFDTQNCEFLSSIGKPGSGELEFASPRGLAVTLDNHIIVAEKGNHRLQEISLDRNGQFVRYFGTNEAGKPGSDPGQFHGPTDVAVGLGGNVFATDSFNQRIQYFKADGTLLGIIGRWGSEPSAFNKPCGICIYNHPEFREKIYVVERQGNRFQCFRQLQGEDGMYTAIALTESGQEQLKEPTGIAVDPQSGYLFVVETQKKLLSIFTSSGELIYSFGTEQLVKPESVAVLEDSRIIVTDSDSGNLIVFRVLQE